MRNLPTEFKSTEREALAVGARNTTQAPAIMFFVLIANLAMYCCDYAVKQLILQDQGSCRVITNSKNSQ